MSQITVERYRSNTPYAPDRAVVTVRHATGKVESIDVSVPHLREALDVGISDDGGAEWFARRAEDAEMARVSAALTEQRARASMAVEMSIKIRTAQQGRMVLDDVVLAEWLRRYDEL